MKLRIIAESEMTKDTDETIRAALCVCYPSGHDIVSQTRSWHGSHPDFSAVLEDDGKLAAHAAVHVRGILVGGEEATVAGVLNVLVMPEYRGRKLSATVVTAVMDEARRRGLDFGLLFCLPKIEKVYARCGWRTVRDTEIVRVDETGAECGLPGRNVAMMLPLNREDFPSGRIHLQGNDW